MALQDQLKTINAGIGGVSIQQRKDDLVLVATLPSKTADRGPHQQRIPLNLKADIPGLKEAHKRALAVAASKIAGSFDWNDLPWDDSPVPTLRLQKKS